MLRLSASEPIANAFLTGKIIGPNRTKLFCHGTLNKRLKVKLPVTHHKILKIQKRDCDHVSHLVRNDDTDPG